MKVRFNKVKSRYVNKFSFDNNTTLGIGNVQPLFCKQVAAGSKISVNFGQLTRLSPLVVPSFARLRQRNDFVFVPMSMVMPSFDAFLSQSSISGSQLLYTPASLPCITNQALFVSLMRDPYLSQCTMSFDSKYDPSPIRNISLAYFNNPVGDITNAFSGVSADNIPDSNKLPHSFFDFIISKDDSVASWTDNRLVFVKLTQAGRFWYTVLRGLGYSVDVNDLSPVSILPLWAFVKAYYDLYYPKRYNPWHVSNYYKQMNFFYNGLHQRVDVGSLTIDFVNNPFVLTPLFGNGHGFDFFATVDDSLATAATTTPINDTSRADSRNLGVFDNTNYTADHDQTIPSYVSAYPSGQPDDYSLTSNVPSLRSGDIHDEKGIAFTADQISLVNKLWNFVQKSSVVGQSVKDWFAVHLGQKTNEDMFDQSILVDSIVNDVSINPVISTAQTTDGEKGDNLGALAGQGYATKNGKVSFEARTFGYFMCLTSLTPISGVSCGSQPELYCNTLYEQQLPDFDGVGYESLNKSSFFESFMNSNLSVHSKKVAGGFGFVPRLSSWKSLHGIRSGLFSLPQVNSSFLPYCADVLPTYPSPSGIIWSFPWSQSGKYLSFNRLFYNQYSTRVAVNSFEHPLDDNFMSQSVFDFVYTSYLKPLSDSYSVESLGNDLLSVKKQ